MHPIPTMCHRAKLPTARNAHIAADCTSCQIKAYAKRCLALAYRQPAHRTPLPKRHTEQCRCKTPNRTTIKAATMNSKQLKLKTSQFLSARTHKQPLLDIIKYFEVSNCNESSI